MSPEIDYTRQRTVAELLAEHGGAAGGRRRRRAGDGPERPPGVGPGGPPPPHAPQPPQAPPPGRPYPGPVVPDRSVLREPVPRELGAAPVPARDFAPPRGGPPARPGAGGPPAGAHRGRPSETIDDRRRRPGDPEHTGVVGFRDAPPRPTPGSPGGRTSGTGSSPMRAVPPAGGSGPIRAVPPAGGSGPIRAVPPAGGSGPLRAVPPANGGPGPREAGRGGPPADNSGRSRAVPPRGAPAPGREQPPAPAAHREPPGRAPGLFDSARDVAAWPSRGGPAARPVPDPGPATGAWDPLAFDDDDEVGPATVVGADARRRGPSAPPRRDPLPSRPGNGGPPTAFVGNGSRPAVDGREDGVAFHGATRRTDDGPATSVGASRGPAARVEAANGPETSVDVGGRRGDGPATRVHGDRRGDGPATRVDSPHRPSPLPGGTATRGDGPATEVAPAGGRRRAPGRPGFGLGFRNGRTGRTDAVPAVGAPAPARAFTGPGASGRVAVPPRTVVEEPTELTGRGALDGRTDVAPRRTPFSPPPARVDGPEPDGYVDEDEFDGHDPEVDDRVLDDRALDERDLDEHDPDDRRLDDRGRDERDRDDLDDRFADELDDLDDLDDPEAGDLDDDLDDRAARPAQEWAGVVAQWLAGAIAGAVLWVLFRYLWRGLPVVALAAAVLVTAGLVLLVRQVLHDADRRTTAFAVLVGLLLTASPAVLVLLGR